MKQGSRVIYFEQCLAILRFSEAFKALKLVKQEMCKEKGFVRFNDTHYYYHLVDVAQILLNTGVREENIITAALLHDLTEDVLDANGNPIYSIERIAELFNPEVAHMVDLVTKNPHIDYKNNKEELIRYLQAISEHYGAALIKTADRIHNFATLMGASRQKRIRTALETEEYFIPFFKVCRNRYPWYASFFFEAKTHIEPHIWTIKEHYREAIALEEEIRSLKEQLDNK